MLLLLIGVSTAAIVVMDVDANVATDVASAAGASIVRIVVSYVVLPEVPIVACVLLCAVVVWNADFMRVSLVLLHLPLYLFQHI